MDLTSSILRSTFAAGPVLDHIQRRLAAVLQGALSVRPRCLVLGHDDEVARGRHRLFLRCTACGRETEGWAIGPQAHAGSATRATPSFSGGHTRQTPTIGSTASMIRRFALARVGDVRRDVRQVVGTARAVRAHLERGGLVRLRLPRHLWPGLGRR